MTTNEKIDFLYSKFVQPNKSQTSVFNSQVWRNGNDIPESLPTFDSNGEYRNLQGNVVLKRIEFERMDLISTGSNAFSSPNVQDIVSCENGFDVSYGYTFYNRSSNGSYIRIPLGAGDYFFDHDSGILFFPNGRNLLYNPRSLYVSFVKYVGLKGIDVSSQFPSTPQPGPTGERGPTGPTGSTGTVNEYAMRYKGTWSSSATYSKWDIVKISNRFMISKADNNTFRPANMNYWEPFGIPQLSTGFNYPDNTYWVSPGFTPTGFLFDGIESAIDDLNGQLFTDATIIVYPGEYTINSNLIVRPGVNINFVFNGKVEISFGSDSQSMNFSQGSKIEFRGNDFSFQNGSIRLNCSNLSIVNGSISKIQLVTTNTSDVSRLMMVDSQVGYLENYASFASLRGTNVVNKITIDDASVTHIEQCMIQSRPDSDPTQEKIEIIASTVPSGFGYENPSLMVKNSRILSNESVVSSSIQPSEPFRLAFIASAMYVRDSSTSFLDLSDPINAFVVNTVVNTTYDDTKLSILNLNGGFQTITANFED